MASLHERAKALFLEAVRQPAGERPRFVTEQCGGDTALRAEVESLLEFHEDGGEENATVDRTEPSGRSASQPGTEVFRTGDVFAGRYRMITRIGRGGMGDVWRADDQVLDTPVAIKLIHGSGPAARERILNEVRLARQITHPAVCRVFDVGEDHGEVFFSMELVNGEDLATLLRRVGRLPSEKVIDIARQLCAGLAAAHAQGILHRDLKPANVLIDDDGRVRITDFGIAVMRGNAGQSAPLGTPGYMAPEQLSRGAPLSERTDLYALGLILYELVVGQHPFTRSGRTSQPRPSARVSDVDARLDRVILQMLSLDPEDRPASAEAIAANLPTSRPLLPGRAMFSRPSLIGAAVVVVVGLLAVAASIIFPRGARALTGQDTIVLADFTNATGEPVFDGALKVALAVALEQSPFLKVFPDDRVRETLRLMGRPPEGPITRPIAREIAQREQLKALLSGSIAGLGRNFVLALEAVNAQTGDVMAREQVEATSKEEVLTMLGRAATRLRGRLGESLASIQKFDVPLARATTPSLEALHSYSLALDEGRVNPRLEAIPYLRQAIEIDPDFALALALLATVYSNTGQTGLAPALAQRAFELRDRVSERERFFISFRYYRDATQDWAKALELTRLWTATYPREAFAFNSLGTAFGHFAQWDQAVEAYQTAIALDPKFVAPYSNLASVFMAMNRFDRAKQVLQQATTNGLSSFPIRRMSYLVAFYEGDSAAMARQFEASVGMGQTNAAYGWQAHSAAFNGSPRTAHEHFRRGIQMAFQAGFKEVAGQLAVEDAEVHAVVGQCRDALKEVPGGLAWSRDNYSLERASRVLALCGRDGEASNLLKELADRFRDATLTMRVSVPLTSATTAVQRKEPKRALEMLEPLRPYDRVPKSEFWPAYLRGQAYLQMQDGRAAVDQFRSILEHRGEYPNAPLYPLAHLGLARGVALAGDIAAARQAYLDFFKLWNGADPDLQPLKDARQEYERLH